MVPIRVTWLELSVRVRRENAALVENLLQNEPVLAVTLTDDADDPVLEPGVAETPLWPAVCITALFSGETPLKPLLALLNLVPGVDRPQQVGVRKFDDQQWERVWLDRFQPMQFGRELWIVPGEQASPPGAKYVLRLDPGLAFGTGSHPTTRMCLQWMDSQDFNGQSVLDFGCGSGVLGIAAAIKGASRVTCVDHDPQALKATRDNAERNHVENIIQVLTSEEFTPGITDVVLANILAGPLVELAPVLLASLRPGGCLLLAGMLSEQTAEVEVAYQAEITGLSVFTDGGWACLHSKKLTEKRFEQRIGK